MNKNHYVEHIIIPTLEYLEPEIPLSENAVNLILLTAIAESNLSDLKQIGGGPALGLLQMEPSTENSLWTHYLSRKPALAQKVLGLTLKAIGRKSNLTGNLFYQVAMARIKYFPDKMRLPNKMDIDGMTEYYRRIYNGGGKADREKVKAIYKFRVLGD